MLFTSESVAAGHPDKLADQISDAIVDAFLAHEPAARVACETLVADDYIVLAGEFRTVDPALFRVLSTQHAPDIAQETVQREAIRHIIEPVIPPHERASDLRCMVNPTGRFEIGGPRGDTGLTGRKVMVDTYGGACPHGGGAFSGKDPSKVDRSAAYLARYIAKNIVAAQLAERCTVQLAYAIGVARPVSLMIDTDGTGRVPDEALEAAVPAVFPLTPQGMIETLQLLRPIYRETAAYGHFGRDDPAFTWERIDRAAMLRRASGA